MESYSPFSKAFNDVCFYAQRALETSVAEAVESVSHLLTLGYTIPECYTYFSAYYENQI